MVAINIFTALVKSPRGEILSYLRRRRRSRRKRRRSRRKRRRRRLVMEQLLMRPMHV